MSELRKRVVAAALLHHPVLDRSGAVVTSAITNIDLHDISRSAYSFGLSSFYVAHPIEAQRELANRIVRHWTDGSGALRIPDRKPPMGIVRVVPTLEAAIDHLGVDAELWVTSAQAQAAVPLGYADAASRLRGAGPPVLIVFGTGWGLAKSVVERAHQHLAPIESPREDGFNHLSVRAAAAITFDRLLG